jgi:hypothetical protein
MTGVAQFRYRPVDVTSDAVGASRLRSKRKDRTVEINRFSFYTWAHSALIGQHKCGTTARETPPARNGFRLLLGDDSNGLHEGL